MIAEVAFDIPVSHAFDYVVPEGWHVAPGQRVRAPLGGAADRRQLQLLADLEGRDIRAPRGGAARVGIVVAVRDGPGDGLKPLHDVLDAMPIFDTARLDLVRWISARSLSSVGSTAAGLLPPLPRRTAKRSSDRRSQRGARSTAGRRVADPMASVEPELNGEHQPAPGTAARTGASSAARSLVKLFTGADREQRVLADIATTAAGALVVLPDGEAAARWARWLAKTDRVVRLDAAVDDTERARAWAALNTGRVRLGVGMRSALLAPLAPGAIVALIDEHEAAHRPPGHPRMHARDVLLERARRESLRLVLTTATPSVEMWWRATSGPAVRVGTDPAPWPTVSIADTRGVLRREPITPELSRALRETLAAGGRAFIAVSRFASALACDECGLVLRCAACGIALMYSRAAASLVCRLCRATTPLPDTCPGCRGRRLSPFGWGAERVEHAVRRRFPRARVARYEPDVRGARAEAQRAAAASADVVIGTRGALRLFGPASLGLAGFVAPDQLLRAPDFRASERVLALVWAAAERVRPDGRLVVQSQNPSHHAFAAVASQALERFYDPELRFRAELGYPPFRRLAIVTIAPGTRSGTNIVDAIGDRLRSVPELTVYPPASIRRGRAVRIVVKGGDELSVVLAEALEPLGRASRRTSRGIIDVEVDPLEWPS